MNYNENSSDTQNELIYQILKNFYFKNNFENLEKIIPIINGQSSLSLRLIDWFVTNYSKKNYTTYKVGDMRFSVYKEYRLKLRAYKKKRFDPFCRWDRVNLPYKNNTYILTTIGQLNFFKWAISNNIVDYIDKNKNVIDKDMISRNTLTRKNNIKSTDNKTRKKRNELSVSATKTIRKEDVEIVVEFN
jgi:hypothetical protein